ncbi:MULTISPECIES: substrate-binding domain-containing protein [Rhizobium/Agrobacterium group]|uniref:substrate-binding domain-containing protein n=1 Tax=Rhizobium/Agrobacterium group TaxID=227290 RepID=UPI000715972B|nr:MULTISPECIES: substrate-binding domain-containing protein [Rhizobium/Agrobacterium group]KQQ49413.1 transcriptional regulator [Rhizobium sp. Leaf311]
MKLKEFAEKVGLSATTVSRALGGYPEVRPETRERVMEAARKFGYRPNANAVRLVTGRAGAIGVVMGRSGGGHFFSEFMGGMASRLESEDTDIVVSVTTDNDLGEELRIFSRLAASGRVDGIIIHSPRPDDERIALLDKLGVPFIVHGRSRTKFEHAWLDIDNHAVTCLATTHLLERGHRRIAFINGPKGRTFVIDRENGYRDALGGAEVEFDPRLVLSAAFSEETAFQFARSLLEQAARPTAFVAGAMMTAQGVYRAASQLGLVIGKDVSVIAHDDVFPYLTPESMLPSLSTTRSSQRMAGERVTDLLLQIIAGRPVAECQELWPVDLVLRQSSGPAP